MSLMTNSQFEQIHTGMIAGRIPRHVGDVRLTIFMLARNLLGTDKLHLLTSIQEDSEYAYYIAAVSSSFASITQFETPLAAAFPGKPGHQGDGVYMLSQGTVSVAIVCDGDKFRLMTNNSDALQGAVDDLDLPIYDLEDVTPVPMASLSGQYRYMADAFSRKFIRASLLISGIAFVIGIAASFTTAALTSTLQNSSKENAEQLNLLVSKIEHASPLSGQIGALQKLSTVVVRAGGWIETYEFVGGREKYLVALPEWVTPDYIGQLGAGAVADRDEKNGTIKVEKK